MSEQAYNENDERYIRKTSELLEILPMFVRNYLYEIENSVLPKTRYMYLYDLKLFFEFLVRQNPDIEKTKDITLEYLNELDYNDFIEYTHSMIESLSEATRARRLASLTRFFSYLYKRRLVTKNQDFYSISRPKVHKKDIVYLESDEVKSVLDNVENGTFLTDRQKRYHQSVRDTAIISLMLGTGIRVSECVSLDINDIDLKKNSIHIFRKGKKEMSVYFTDEVCANLSLYMEERLQMDNIEKGHEDAFFISRKHRRISIRAVEDLVRKYAGEHVTGGKHISAHKLRSSYGTNLYRSSGDIYLVASVLGHESINTTAAAYSAQSEEALKRAGRMNLYN